jgi:short-subunit dehydrogenase
MSKTLFITGSSSGIGKETVKLFASKGWNVAATLRNPEKESELQSLPGVTLLKLDVTQPESVTNAVNQAIEIYGKIDVLVNNAGFGVLGAFEPAGEDQIQKQFDANVFGLMRVTRAILPHFRQNKQGTIINVSSIAGRHTFPFFSIYHASKFAVEGFSESLYYELRPYQVKIKLIEPGPIKTDFDGRSLDHTNTSNLTEYQTANAKTSQFYQLMYRYAESPQTVAATIWKAANSNNYKLRYPSGYLAKLTLLMMKIAPLWKQRWLLRQLINI